VSVQTESGGARRTDLIAAPLLLVLAGVVIWETLDYPASLVPGSPGPALVPRVLAGLLAGIALVIGARAWRTRESRAVDGSEISWSRVGLTVMFLGLFLWVLTFGDFFIVLPLFLGALMVVMGERSWKTVVVVPLFFDLFVYLVFYQVFGVRLPTVLF
jgi:hypothetical protein